MGPPKVPPKNGPKRPAMNSPGKSTQFCIDESSRFFTLSIARLPSHATRCFPYSVEECTQSNFPETTVNRSSPSRDDNAPGCVFKQSEQKCSRPPLPKSSQVKEKKKKRQYSYKKPRAAKKANFEVKGVEKENEGKSLSQSPTLAEISNGSVDQYANGSKFNRYSLLDEALAEVSSSIAALCIPSPIVDGLEAIESIASDQSKEEENESILKLSKKYKEKMNNVWDEFQADLKSFLTKEKKRSCNEGVIQDMIEPEVPLEDINMEPDQALSPVIVPLEISVKKLSGKSLSRFLKPSKRVLPSASSTNRPLDTSKNSEPVAEKRKRKQKELKISVAIRKSSRLIKIPQKFLESGHSLRKVAGKSKAIKKRKHLTPAKLDESASSKRKQKSSVYQDLKKKINLNSTQVSTDQLEDFSPGNTPLNTPGTPGKMSKQLKIEITRLKDSV